MRWWREGTYSPTGDCFDIGIATLAALARFERTGDPASGDPDPMSAGNGCLMRLAPASIFYWDDHERAAEAGRRQCATTHGAGTCLAASSWFAELLARTIASEAKPDLFAPGVTRFGGRVAELEGGWRGKSRAQIRSIGYLSYSLEAALWCVGKAGSFEEADLI